MPKVSLRSVGRLGSGHVLGPEWARVSDLLVTNLVGAVTSIVGFAGLWMAGNQRRAGWAVGLASEVLWVIYAVLLGQWVLLPTCVIWGFVYGRNFLRWGGSTP